MWLSTVCSEMSGRGDLFVGPVVDDQLGNLGLPFPEWTRARITRSRVGDVGGFAQRQADRGASTQPLAGLELCLGTDVFPAPLLSTRWPGPEMGRGGAARSRRRWFARRPPPRSVVPRAVVGRYRRRGSPASRAGSTARPDHRSGERVREGRTHAALVLDGDQCALAEIARHGGSTVESYPEDTDDRTLSGSFLHTGPMAALGKPRLHAHPPDLPTLLGRHPHRLPRLTCRTATRSARSSWTCPGSCRRRCGCSPPATAARSTRSTRTRWPWWRCAPRSAAPEQTVNRQFPQDRRWIQAKCCLATGGVVGGTGLDQLAWTMLCGVGDSGYSIVQRACGSSVVAEDLPALHSGQSVFDPERGSCGGLR